MSKPKSESEITPFQFGLLLLSLLLLGGLGLELFVPMPLELARLIGLIDTAVCVALLIDFGARLRAAPSKLRFLRWGWIDLIASIPALDVLRWGRLLRILRVLRIVVGLRSLRRLLRVLFADRRQAGLATMFVLVFVLVAFASAGMLLLETAPTSNIRTAEDALWWSMTTITTVGYGDHYPTTELGRLIASGLMISGIGLFGTLSGVAASYFLGKGGDSDGRAEPDLHALSSRLSALEEHLCLSRSHPTANNTDETHSPLKNNHGNHSEESRRASQHVG